MRTISISFLLSCFLLLSGLSTPAMACPPPDCGDCHTWDPNIKECVPYGDCWGGCPECESCVSCYCECTSECCTDLDCEYGGEGCESCVDCICEDDDSKCNSCQNCSDGECVLKPTSECDEDSDCGNPSCNECVSCACVEVTVASATSDEDAACVGCSVTFTATTEPTGHESEVSWSGGGDPSTGTGATFVTTWQTTGTKMVTASLCGSSVSENVTIAEVASVTADEDDACINEDVTFTVTTNPPGHYDLISWSGGGNPPSQEGGQTFTTKWSTCGTQTVTATCGTSSDSDSVTIKGVASVTASESEVCDGEIVVFITVTVPTGNESNITWSGGGTPATGTGAVFYTKWTTGSTGARTVTASYCNDSESESVNVLVGCDCDRPGS